MSLTSPPARSSSLSSVPPTGALSAEQTGSSISHALGLLGLLGLLVGVFFVAAGSASHPSIYVPAHSGGWPRWLAGPFEGLGIGISSSRFQLFTLIMCASYVLVLLCARSLSRTALVTTILGAHLILLLGPPLISADVFGYLGFARLGALHGLDPYTHVAAQIPTDPVIHFLGWLHQHSPYGPLFTLGTYALVPLGLSGGLWALKAIAVLASLGAVALTARAASAQGRSPVMAAAFLGLNPVLLELAVGGAHNDTLILLALSGALVLTATATPRFRAAAMTLLAGVGIKITAGLALPFVLLAPRDWRHRFSAALGGFACLAALAAISLIGFGSHALGFLDAVGEQQQLVATHSVPAETARLVGLDGVPGWWRHLFIAAFVVVLAFAMWRTARGADWRTAAGWSTLTLLCATAWLLPWYAIWALPLAAVSTSRSLRIATLMMCGYAILIHLPLAAGLLSPK